MPRAFQVPQEIDEERAKAEQGERARPEVLEGGAVMMPTATWHRDER